MDNLLGEGEPVDEEQVEMFLDYFDETRLQIRFVEYPDLPAEEVWSIDFFLAEEQYGRDDLIRELKRALIDPDGHSVPHVLDVKRSHLDWGASAASQEIIVEVTNAVLDQGLDAVVDGVKIGVGAALKLLWDRWRRRARGSRDFQMIEGLDDARGKAKERLERAFGVDPEKLTVTDETSELEPSRWTFHFHGDDCDYKIVLEAIGDDAITAMISRTPRSD